MPLPELKFPTSISPTQRSAFVMCPQQWFWRYCAGIRPGGRSIHLGAGDAFAKGLEAARRAFYVNNTSPREALDCGLDALEKIYLSEEMQGDAPAKSLAGMSGALHYYFDVWPLGRDHFIPATFGPERGVEYTFSVPLDIAHPDTGDPILFGGRIDMVARYKQDGVIWVVDDKTSGGLGPQWRNQWKLDSQITAYVWAAQQFGYPAAGAVIRGVGILKTMYKSDEVMEPRGEGFLKRWEEQLKRDINDMVDTYLQAKIQGLTLTPRRALDKAICGAYSGCPYMQACLSDDPAPWLEAIVLPPAQAAIPEDFKEFFS